MHGSSRIAHWCRIGSRSGDRSDAGCTRATTSWAGNQSTIKAENDIRANAVNPLTSFLNIATGGLEGYKAWSKPSGGYQ